MSTWPATPLSGRLVALEPLRSVHVPALVQAADDPRLFRWTGARPVVDDDSASAYIDTALRQPDRLAYLQRDRRTGAPVGSTSFYQIDDSQQVVAIGYTWLSVSAQGSGLNAESKYLMLRHAFEEREVVRVEWHTHEDNERSRAAIEKLGARFEGLLRKHRRLPDGGWRTTALYAATDEDWPRIRQGLQDRLAALDPASPDPGNNPGGAALHGV